MNELADPRTIDPIDMERTAVALRKRMFRVDAPPQRIGRFVVRSTAGTGAVGRVYLARDPKLERDVAVKMLRTELDGNATDLVQEARALAALDHPNVLPVFEVGESDGRAYIVMEYVVGTTLREWVRDNTPSRSAIVDALAQAGAGLAAAHRAGLVHRDFKPDNVMVGEDGAVRVTDFGLARSSSTPSRATSDRASGASPVGTRLAGTPGYIAPELLGGADASPRSDQYAWCISLLELLEGARPSEEQPVGEILKGVPLGLRRVLSRGLDSNPDRRFADMPALLARLAPRAFRTVLALCLLIFGAGLTLAVVDSTVRQEPAPTCDAGAKSIAETWSAARASRLRERFVDGGLTSERSWGRSAATLDAYAQAWVDEYQDNCRAAHMRNVQSAEDLDLRTRCLRERRRYLAAFLDDLDAVDTAADVARVPRAVVGLPPIETCGDLDALSRTRLPQDPQRRAQVEAIRDDLTGVRATAVLGRTPDPELVAAIVARARKAAHAPTLVSVCELASRIAWGTAETSESIALGEEAYFAAAGIDDVEGMARIAAMLALRFAGRVKDPAQAATWIKHGRAALANRSGTPAHHGVLLAEATIAEKRHRFDQAQERLLEALAVAQRLPSPGDRMKRRGETLSHLADVTFAQSDLEASLRHSTDAVEVFTNLVGPDSRDTWAALTKQGRAQAVGGRNGAAQATFERLIKSIEGTHPHSHLLVVAYNGLGNVLMNRGKFEAAARAFERCAALHKADSGADHPDRAVNLGNVGKAWHAAGDTERARVVLEEALEIHTTLLDANDPAVAYVLSTLGHVESAAGRHSRAAEHVQRALRIRIEKLGVDHRLVAASHGDLATILSAAQDEAGARQHYASAAAVYRKSARPESSDRMLSLRDWGAFEARTGAHARAKVLLLEAVAAAELVAEPNPNDIVRLRLSLARARWGGGEQDTAVDEARAAQSILARAAEADPALAKEVDAWIETHEHG